MSYNSPKDYGTTTYPVHAVSPPALLKRVEPLLTPDQLKSRHLKGVLELAARFGISYTSDELKDRINLAMNQAEIELGIPVVGYEVQEKHPFDQNLYKSYIHIRTEQGPIIELRDLAIVSSNKQTIFEVPSEWVEAAQFHQRQINVIPLLSSFGGTTFNAPVASGGIAYLSILLNSLGYVPSYWQVKYLIGMCKDAGSVPVVANTLIGAMAAMDILSSIAPNNANTSVSLSQDGIGQSSSTPGPQIFQQRMQELQMQKETLMRQIKRVFGGKFFLTNI